MQAKSNLPSPISVLYNWEQEATEKAFDAQSNIVREAVADKNSQGLVGRYQR